MKDNPTIKKLKTEIKDLKSIISDQGERHKTLQIKNDKLGCEMNRLESSNIYWKRRARELKVQVEKYDKR